MGLPSWISLFLANWSMGQCWGTLAAYKYEFWPILALGSVNDPGSMDSLDPVSRTNIM